MKRFALLPMILYASIFACHAQSIKVTKGHFIHVIKRAERLAKKELDYNCEWFTNDTDNNFSKADTVHFYSSDGRKNLALRGVCRTIGWVFPDIHHLHVHENLFCQEPPFFRTSNDGRYDYQLLVSAAHHKVILSTINWLSKKRESYEVVQLRECFPADFSGAYYQMTLVRLSVQ